MADSGSPMWTPELRLAKGWWLMAEGERKRLVLRKRCVLYIQGYAHTRTQSASRDLGLCPLTLFQVDGATYTRTLTYLNIHTLTHTHVDVTLYLAAASRHHARYPTQNAGGNYWTHSHGEECREQVVEIGSWRKRAREWERGMKEERKGDCGWKRRIYTH